MKITATSLPGMRTDEQVEKLEGMVGELRGAPDTPGVPPGLQAPLPLGQGASAVTSTQPWSSANHPQGVGASTYGSDPSISNPTVAPSGSGDVQAFDGAGESNDPVPRRDRTSLPRLSVGGGTATENVHSLQQWMTQVAIVLSTWCVGATEWWHQVISEARKDHVAFCKMSPKERALVGGKSKEVFALPTTVSPLEGQNRADLLREELLPRTVKSQRHLQGVDTVVGILKVVIREFMPSEHTCRIETLQSLERPLRAGKNYKECLLSLRRFNYDLRVLVHELGTAPDYLRMYRSLGDLPSNILRDDPLFAADLSGLLHESRIEQVQDKEAFDIYVEGLEKLFHAGSLKEEEKSRKGYRNPEVHAADGKKPRQEFKKKDSDNRRQGEKLGKRKERSQSRPRDDKRPDRAREAPGGDKKGESSLRPLCKDFVKPEGCRFGRSCKFYHPNKAGKCRRDHVSSLTWARETSEGGAEDESSRTDQGDARSLEVIDLGSEVEGPVVMTARQGDDKRPLLDTGASHILLQLDLIDETTAEEAKRIPVHQATGRPKRALLLKGVIYAAGVVRPLVSVGALKEKLGLHFSWAQEQPSLMMARMDGIGRQENIRGRVDGRLPILEYEQFEVVLRAYSDAHNGKTPMERDVWLRELGGDLGVSQNDPTAAMGTMDHLVGLPTTAAEAESRVLQHVIPAPTRTNIREDDMPPPRSQTFGVTIARGRGITLPTFKYAVLVAAVHLLAALRPCVDPYTSFQPNETPSVGLKLHENMKNEGKSWVTSYGSYRGRELWIEERDPRKSRRRGLVPPPNPRNEEERGLLGRMVCTKGQWVKFNPRLRHAVFPVVEGRRVSITLFTMKGWESLGEMFTQELLDLGFPLPMKHDCEEAYDVAFLTTMPFEVQPLPGDDFQDLSRGDLGVSRVGGGSRTYHRH